MLVTNFASSYKIQGFLFAKKCITKGLFQETSIHLNSMFISIRMVLVCGKIWTQKKVRDPRLSSFPMKFILVGEKTIAQSTVKYCCPRNEREDGAKSTKEV